MADPIHINCLNCNYNLVRIDLAGVCPECGTRILQRCFWCQYDLTNTSPKDNCPECGVPAINSIGDGILATAPDALLQSIHTGFKLASMLIPVSILWIMSMPTIMGFYFIEMDTATFNFWLIQLLHVSKLLILAMIFGWWKLAVPIPGLPESITGSLQRKLLNAALIVYATIIAISIPISFIPTNPDPIAASELIDYITIVLRWIGLLSLAVLYFAQLWYMQWFAKLTKNPMMHKRAKYMVWLGPIIVMFGFIFSLTSVGAIASFIIAPFIVLALYWSLLVCIRKDIKAIRTRKAALS